MRGMSGQQVIEQAVTTCIDVGDGDQASQFFDLANSILEECKDAALLSVLDAAICLFSEALDRRPAPHPLRSTSLKDLAGALATRFTLNNQQQDIDELLALCSKQVLSKAGEQLQVRIQPTSVSTTDTCDTPKDSVAEHGSISTGGWDDSEASEMSKLAREALADFNQSVQISSLDKALSLHRDALCLRPNPHPKRVVSLGNVAAALYARFRRTDDMENLDEAISVLRSAVEACPASDGFRVDLLNRLCAVLASKFDKTSELWYLNEAKEIWRDLPQASDNDDDVGDSIQLFNFATSLLKEFEKSGQIADLETTISLFREGLVLLPDKHLSRQSAHNNLAFALSMRFERSGKREDMDDAIALHQKVLEMQSVPHPARAMSLDNLATALTTRFEQAGQHEDLENAISFLQESLALRPAPHPDRSICLSNLASVLKIRFEQSGQREDLDNAISFLIETLALRPALNLDRSKSLNSLGNALTLRFQQSAQRKDLDNSISFLKESLALRPAPHPDRSHSLNNFANALEIRFKCSGQREDLDDAILFHREALGLQSTTSPDQFLSLNNLANVLMIRFLQSGQREDLDNGITFYRDALELTSGCHPHRSSVLNNLAAALITRNDLADQLEDIDSAISFSRAALELQPVPHPGRPTSLNNLAGALIDRFHHSGQHMDLDEAILCHKASLELLPASHLDRSGALSNLATALGTQFGQSGRPDDLDEAISLQREAIRLEIAPHPNRCRSLGELANFLSKKFKQAGQRKDLNDAINTYYESLHAHVSGHPGTCKTSANLGRTLMVAYSHTHESEYLDKAMAAFRAAVACKTAPVSVRFIAAKLWAYNADDWSHESALDAYRAAIELLPHLAMLSLDLQGRQQALKSGSNGLARNAATCAIQVGQYAQAVELLEEGRAVFWSQALQLRTPMTKLHDAKPDLEKRLRYISLALEQGSLLDMSRSLSGTPWQKSTTMEQEATRLRRLNDEWLATLEEVRQLNGFQDFLRPSRLSALQDAAADGPIVILNTSASSSDALILTISGVEHVPLPDLSLADVELLVKEIQIASMSSRKNPSLPEADYARIHGAFRQIRVLSSPLQFLNLSVEARHAHRASDDQMQPEDIFRRVLGILWVSAVEPVIRRLSLEASCLSRQR
jgi:hypothetical protein